MPEYCKTATDGAIPSGNSVMLGNLQKLSILLDRSDLRQKAEQIIRVIEDLGLQPFVPPEPLPEITHDDVYCVTWLALV